MTEFKVLEAPLISREEVFRCMRSENSSDELAQLVDSAIAESAREFQYKVLYCKLKFTINDDICDFGEFSCRSRALANALHGFDTAVVFLASVGVGIDRLISRYTKISPARALALGAVGCERVEALADAFCEQLSEEYTVGKRFSAGYADLCLEVQRDIFKLLAPQATMGVYLTDSLLMTPSKSVTAFIGIKAKD